MLQIQTKSDRKIGASVHLDDSDFEQCKLFITCTSEGYTFSFFSLMNQFAEVFEKMPVESQ